MGWQQVLRRDVAIHTVTFKLPCTLNSVASKELNWPAWTRSPRQGTRTAAVLASCQQQSRSVRSLSGSGLLDGGPQLCLRFRQLEATTTLCFIVSPQQWPPACQCRCSWYQYSDIDKANMLAVKARAPA